jgi:hypothetical protein
MSLTQRGADLTVRIVVPEIAAAARLEIVVYEPGGAEWRRLEQVVVDPPTIPGGYEIVVTVPLADPEPPPPGRWRVLAWLDGHPPLVEWFGR